MPLPQNFSAWEHLQSTLMRVYNRRVREEFSDVGDDNWSPDISTSRGGLRVACTLVDDDTAVMTLIRLFLFYIILRKAQDLQTPIYGIPVPSFQEARKFQPQIQLYFQEDIADVEPGFAPVTGEISFRLMNESKETLTEADLERFAQKVRANFATGGGFVWKKGKVMCSYTDRPRGYQLQLLCRSKAEARRVIEQVLDIQGYQPNWQYLNTSENEAPSQRYPTLPGRQTILGKSRQRPRQRPTADCRFQYAALHIHGLPNPVILVDRSGHFSRPLIRA